MHRVDARREGALSALPRKSRGSSPAAMPRIEGAFLLHVLARSLATGEAEVASRGFFDVMDRPPAVFCLGVTARRAAHGASQLDRALIALVPKADLERAEAGLRACPNGSLAWLEDAAPGLARQVSTRIDTGPAGAEPA